MTFATRIACLLIPVCASTQARAQSNLLINGDFEMVNTPGCNSNLSNSSLGSYLPTLTGFGTADEIDVYTDPPCYGLPAFHGTTKLALDSNSIGNVDAFSFGLTSPIVSGVSYTINFAGHAEIDFTSSIGSVDIGISNDPLMFGTQVASFAMSSPTAWSTFNATFVAPNNALYLTVQAGSAQQGWTHVDDFSLTGNTAMSYCAGDGAGTACPCGNNSATGAGEGCTNSLGVGGRLRSTGGSSLSNDTLVLTGDQMPNSSALYFQGTQQTAGGAGTVFGDGLRCASGAIIRIGVKLNAGNASQYPGPGNQSVHLRGQVAAPGIRDYQVWYRNSAAFCTPSTFNVTNGIEVTWTP